MTFVAILFIIVGILMYIGGVIAGRRPQSEKAPTPQTIRMIMTIISIVDIAIGSAIIGLNFEG